MQPVLCVLCLFMVSCVDSPKFQIPVKNKLNDSDLTSDSNSENSRIEFLRICDKPDTESKYTLEVLREAYELGDCSSVYSFLAEASAISLRNWGRMVPSERPAEIAPINRSVVDISIFRFATNLVDLDFWQNSISDLKPLSELKNLETLNLEGNEIRDIEPLKSLTKLEILDLSLAYNLQDIAALSNLKKLKYLNLRKTGVSDVKALSSLNKLEVLRIGEAKVIDCMPLINLTNLREIEVGMTSPQNIPAFSAMNKLEKLQLQLSTIDNIDFLQKFPGLTELNLAISKGDPDLTPLATLKNLKKLTYWPYRDTSSDTSLMGRNYAKLGALTSLESLELDDDTPVDISFIVSLTKLKSLHFKTYPLNPELIGRLPGLSSLFLRAGPTANYQYLSTLNKLEKLTLWGGSATSNLALIGNIQSLKDLELRYVDDFDINALSRLTNLNRLVLDSLSRAINDLSPLNSLSKLRQLEVSRNTGTFSLASIPSLTNLLELNVGNNRSMIVDGIEKFSNLEVLTIEGLGDQSMPKISQLKKLRAFYAPNSTFTNLSFLQNLSDLTAINVALNMALKDIDATSTLRQLEVLDIEATGVEDISSLTNLQFLKTIKLKNTGLKSLAPLSESPRLAVIDIMDSPLAAASLDKICPQNAKSQVLRDLCK